MQGFVVRNYRPILLILVALVVILAFLVGYEEGKREQGNTVVLSCSDDTLSELMVPVQTLASGNIPHATTSRTEDLHLEQQVAGATVTAPAGTYVGSKNGTKYYMPTCGTVKRIKPENYIWFKTAEDAKMQGYSEGSC